MSQACLHPGGLSLTRRTLALGNLNPGARVLDVGCGAGATVALLLQQGYRAYGVDANPTAVNPRIQKANAARLPFEDGSMDAVIMECSLSKMPRPEAALAEARRVLPLGGVLLMADLFAQGQPSDFDGALGRLARWPDIYTLARQAGFSLRQWEEHAEALASYWGQMLFELGPDAAQNALGGSREPLKAARCSYFVAVLQAAQIPMAPLSPLHNWVFERASVTTGDADALARYQQRQAAETVARARADSPFYRAHLAGADPANWAELPFTSAPVLAEQGPRMLCVPLSRIERIRTLNTSGSTGPPKRVWFTAEDMQRTVDFFAVGMGPLAAPGQQVGILMSDDKPGSIAQLLRQGLARYGAKGIIGGPLRDWRATAQLAAGCDCLVGIPAQVLYLCRKQPDLRPKTVLLSADYVSPALIAAITRAWGCRVYTHYGLTETCYGLAVQCDALQKQHLRSADFLVEIVHPGTGQPLPPGEVGEVVLTSLQNEALPLIRYRTGDMASLQSGCACGCGLPGLGPVLGRIQNLRQTVNIHQLDDVLFALPGLCSYTARLSGAQLHLTLEGPRQQEADIKRWLAIDTVIEYGPAPPFSAGGKRRLEKND